MTKVLALKIIPSYINIPNTQNSKNGRCKFYGTNIKIGAGYQINNRLNTYISNYIPISGNKSFNEKLEFGKTNIYAFKLNYAIDEKIY